MTREALLAEVMRLAPEERRAFALEVLGSSDRTSAFVDPMLPDVEASHRSELERRLQLSDAGQLRYGPWEAVKARLLARGA